MRPVGSSPPPPSSPPASAGDLTPFPYDTERPPEVASAYRAQLRRDIRAQWEGYRQLPPQLRTWLTHAMLYVARSLRWIEGLSAQDLTPEVRAKLPLLGRTMERIVHDLKSPYLENMSLALLGLERLQNRLIRPGSAVVTRIAVNMTLANELDPSGNMGSAFKQAVVEWLQWRFGVERISINPEGTSFLVVREAGSETGFDAEEFAREILFRLEQQGMQQKYRYEPWHLEGFLPRAHVITMQVDASDLPVAERMRSGTRDEIHDLHRRVLDRCEQSLRLLAVGGTILEKEPAELGVAAGIEVFDGNFLRDPVLQQQEPLASRLRQGYGYVPPSRYVPPLDQLRGTDPALSRHPRYQHNYGRLSHPARADDHGGALQVLLAALREASLAGEGPAQLQALEHLRSAADRFGIAFEIAWEARRNPRNPALFTKWVQEVRLHDATTRYDSYFIEEIARIASDRLHLAVVEVDSFKAFSLAHEVKSADEDFWAIFDVIALLAREQEIDGISFAKVAGDLVAVALPSVDREGNAVSLDAFMREAQRRVKDRYRDRPFQDYAKVTLQNARGRNVLRMPLWQRVGDPTGRPFPAPGRPAGAVPFRNTVSISWTGTTIHTPRTEKAVTLLPRIVDELATQVEQLKSASAPFKGVARNVTASISLTPEPPSVFVGGVHPQLINKPLQVPEELVRSVGEQFAAAWGREIWERFDPQLKRQFFNRLSEQLHELPPVLQPPAVGQLFAVSSAYRPIQPLPLMPTIFVSMFPMAI